MAGSPASARLVECVHGFSTRLEPYGTTLQVGEFLAYLDSGFAF
jgi:hypothetical protein